jgi:hypothetical protein
MATVPVLRPDVHPWWEDDAHSEFTGHFDSVQRDQLIHEDLFAGRSVSLVLVSIVLGGALLMAATVLTTL